MRILVVDDNRDAAVTLAMLLKIMGNEVFTAHDGEEAVVRAGIEKPDLVLCDIGLPKLSGYDVCRQIRQASWGQAMTLVAVTGWGQEEDRHKCFDAGFHHHMVKPVDPKILMSMIVELDAGLRSRSP